MTIRSHFIPLLVVALSGSCGCAMQQGGSDESDSQGVAAEAALNISMSCDVIVAGGSTAALAAALTSAREGANTCLLEPTDWPGGQLTAGGVPAVDFAWHKIGTYDVGAIAKQAENLPSEFVKWMNETGNPGGCWVSKNCFEPKDLLSSRILPALNTPNLTVLKNTVVKQAGTTKQGGRTRISSITAIRRTPREGVAWGGYDIPLSQDMADWYSPDNSSRYTKDIITITSKRANGPVVIDATELGDVLVLSGASYLQGVESADGSTQIQDDTCGQAFVFPFVMRMNDTAVADNAPAGNPDHPEFYGMGASSWDKIWTYRRVKGNGGVAAGQLSNQNWNPGNDYAYGYLLRSKSDAEAERSDWKGGVNYEALEAAERHAWGWYRWLRNHDPARGGKTSLAMGVFGTAHGLSKFPYVRDTRRSIGIGDFVLKASDIDGPASQRTGKAFADRIAIGAYNGDIHPMKTCSLPGYLSSELNALPFYIPLRALTNRDVANLLVAGKTMAQSFKANAAIRLHPIEYSTGIGAGAAAASMIAQQLDDTAELIPRYAAVQTRVRKYAPIDWTINGTKYPQPGQALEPISGAATEATAFCPPGATADMSLGYCVDDQNAYGPFTNEMTKLCVQYGGGPSCSATREFQIDGHTVAIPRWGRQFARGLRGDGECMRGAHRDQAFTQTCVEEASASISGQKEAYGPFLSEVTQRCIAAKGGDACYVNRWSYAFFSSLMK